MSGKWNEIPKWSGVTVSHLPASIRSSSRLFADECVVYREIQTKMTVIFFKMWDWEKKWGMSFHPETCSILRVQRNDAPVMFDYSLKGHTLICEESTRYLGVDLSQDMSWKGTSRQRSGKGTIRKRFPLQKPRWEKTKLTIRYLYHGTYRKPNLLFSHSSMM